MNRKLLTVIICLFLAISAGCSNKNNTQNTFEITGSITSIDQTSSIIQIENNGPLYVNDISKYHIGQQVKVKIHNEKNTDVWDPKTLDVIEISMIE